MKYIIKCNNGYYAEDPVKEQIKSIVTELNDARVFETTTKLTEDIIKEDFDLQ